MNHPLRPALTLPVTVLILTFAWAAPARPADPPGGDYEVEITKKDLGKEAVIRKGDKEWFMMIEVTPENTVIIRQEKEKDAYLVDESETHDRAMTKDEVNAAIDAFVNGVKSQGKLNKK
ncbi:MAG TPA: hypothetical protein VGA17_03560 [Nitrospiraceae bacterium]